MNRLGQLIFDYRKRNELSQRQLAEQIGIDTSYLVQIENGKRVPKAKTAKRIYDHVKGE